MNNVWVASDWHLWTKNLNGRHPFVSTAKIDQLISNYTEVIQPTDIFIYLGDLCDPEVADIKKLQAFISSIPGYKILCKGDHDTEIPEFYLNLGFNDVCDICKIHSIIFSHMPVKVAPDMINIHGDSHSRKQSNLGYQHICVYDKDETMCPSLVDDLLQNPPNTNPEKYGASTEDQEQNIFRTYHDDALVNIIDISSKVDLYPMDEVAAQSNVYAAMDLNELQTPQDLYEWMRKNIHYGNYTKLKTDVQLLKSHSGSCHDQVYFAYPRLRQMGVNPKILFFVEYKEGQSKGGMTHTLIYWKDEHSDKVMWFENAWNGQQGIHEFDSFDSLKKYIEDEHDRMPSSKNFPNLYFKNVPFNRFKAGMTLQELVKAIMEGDELDESTEIVYGDIILESISGDGFKSREMSPEFAMLVETARMEVENDPIDEIIFDDIESTKHWLSDDDDDMTKPKHEPMAESKIEFVNDEGKEVPKVCPDCGSKVGVFLQGEPVFLCTNKKCKKYFGTVPCNLDESVRELAKAGKAVNIYRIHTISADDELESAGAPFANTVAGAVENYRRENWKTKEPPAEAYVHVPEIGYYDFRHSDEYWNSWWSTNNINLKLIGKIKINDDWSWEWIEKYNDDGTVVNLDEAATENKPEKYKSLNSFKHKVCDEGELVHWKEKFPEELSRLDPDVNTTVTLWMTKDESKMVAYIALEQKGNQTIMQTLGVFPEYRSYGLDKQLMKYAKINGATLLYVNPSNKTAVNLYKSCGWKYAGWKNRGMVQPMVLDEAATKTDSGLKVTTKNTTNPNDSVSTKAVALNFYDGKDHIGEVYISAVDTKEGFIYNLEVFKKYRGKGYGRKIMEYVLDNYDATDLTVDPDNEIAIKLYKSLGFKFKRKIKDPTDGAEVLWFHRNLTRSVNEAAAQLQGYDRKQQEDVSKKYGIKAVGHDTPDDTPEKRVDQRREKQLKNLKKARKVKKRKAFVRKIKSKLPGNHNKKNEDVDISDIPVNQGEKNFFDRSVAAFDFENETGYKFAMAENIKFIDAINESSSADNKLYPVYIMLMHSGTALATAIKTITQSHFSHSSISFDSSMKSMYSFGRKMDTNPFIGSFKKENIHDDFFKGKSIPYALYVVPCTKDEIGLMKKRLDYFIKNATKFHYDFTGLFKNYLGIADNPEYKWFCSRFVADILNAGRPSSDPYVVEPSLMKPEDFLYTNFAIYVTGGLLDAYDQDRVDAITRRILRVEEIKRRKEKQIVQNEAVDVFDLDPFDPLQEAVLSYHLSALSENAFGDFMNYLKSFKVRFDKNGNVIITRREYDQLDKHFRQSIRMLKAYEKANDVESVKEELCKIYYMIGLINQHYLNPANKQNKTVKSDIRKEMMDLRSVMMNVFQQHLTYVTNQDPKFNFQQYYNHSKYSSTVEIPNTVISAVGKALVTGLK